MSITKIAKMTTEITADYQKISDLNVAFYNQDVNTAILQFNVTRNNAPVPLGKVNVDGYIVLLAADGSRIQDAVEITDEINGVIEYTIPKEFLKHTGTAVGQIYIAVKGKDDTAVMRQFSFDINKDLLTGFSATKKLEYIKTFDDLTTFIKQRVQAIDKAIANGANYETAMKKAAEKGQKDIQAVATKATTDVNKAANDATKKITDTSNTTVATVNAKGDAVLKAFAENGQVPKITADNGRFYYNLADNKADILASVISESGFKTGYAHFTVLNGLGNNRSFRFTSYYYPTNGYIHAVDTAGQSHIRVCNGGAWSAWKSIADTSVTQNFKITNDDGSAIATTGYNLLNITDVASFDGYSEASINVPASVNAAGYIKRKYKSGHVEVTYSPYNTNEIYRNSYNSATKSWVGWEKLVTASELTVLESKVNTSKPVTLWSGSANGVSSTPYALSQAINTSRKIRVTYDFPGASGKTAVVDLSNTKTLIIHDFNLTDSDANGGGLYEFQLDFTALNKFTIKADTVKDLNGTGKIDQKNITVRKIEEGDY